MFQFVYLVFSLFLLVVWFVLYFLKPASRKEIFWVSFWTMFLAFTEPFFVPEYWNPPTLFDLARQTGFDLESFIFCFAVGGIVVVIYEAIFKNKHIKISLKEKHKKRHRLHFWVVISAPVTFFLLLLISDLNPIYSGIIALLVGFFATWYCRPDLVRKMIVSGVLFLMVYFIVFSMLNLFFTGYTDLVWNLKAISGVKFFEVPIEELMWAFTFGLYWSSVYEHIGWYKLKSVKG